MVPWACVQRLKGNDGKYVDVPTLTACQECSTIGLEVLGVSSWERFLDAFTDDLDVQRDVQQCRKNLRTPGAVVAGTAIDAKRVAFRGFSFVTGGHMRLAVFAPSVYVRLAVCAPSVYVRVPDNTESTSQ